MLLLASELLSARLLMAFTLAFHIVLACLGVGLPVLLLLAEGRFLKTGDEGWRLLARRWAKSFAVLFAVGAVSGTVLSFELGLMWPGFMGRWGAVIGLPFTLEGFAFFLEAIFVGIYLYSWDRLPPRVHWWTGVPIALSGAASACFVMLVNAWMHTPRGFDLDAAGQVVGVRPLKAMFTPAALTMTLHMLVAAYMVTGGLVATVYAVQRLRGRDTTYERRAMALGLLLLLPLAPIQAAVGHATGEMVAEVQPVKFATMKGQFVTQRRAPLRVGGWPDEERRETRFALEIPGMLSWMGYRDVDAEVLGLNDVPRDQWPPVWICYQAFQAMVGIGTFLIALALGTAVWLWRKRALPTHTGYLCAVAAAGPLSVIALQAGWVLTEVGRQPWIVQGHMRTSEAVTDAPGVGLVLAAVVAFYGVLLAGTAVVLRALANQPLPAPAPEAAADGA